MREVIAGGEGDEAARDGRGLSELEFVLTSLLELGVIEDWSIRPFIKKFRMLDVDQSGRLSRDDLLHKRSVDLLKIAPGGQAGLKRVDTRQRASRVAPAPDAAATR